MNKNKHVVFNSHLENNITQNAVDEEVKLIVEADINNNLIQQSLLDDIRCFNIRSATVMKEDIN